MNYNRIEQAVDILTLQNTHLVIVGAGGAYNLILNFARTGIGKLTVLDYDTVDDTNIVRQGYMQKDIGRYKVDAVADAIAAINPDVIYEGIIQNFHSMPSEELDRIFGSADMLLLLTDSFNAQKFGNILALDYNKPALWAGWYAKSRTAEIFFQIPGYTPACFRCAVKSRYEIQENEEVHISSHCNTIFHSELLDAYIGLLVLGILHRDHPDTDKESVAFFQGVLNDDETLDWNFLQLKVHPLGGNVLFDREYGDLDKYAQNFTSCWQSNAPDTDPANGNIICPDCRGMLQDLVTHRLSNSKP